MSHGWSLSGAVNYVRGKRKDIDDDLYRIAPLNGFLALDYLREQWGWSLEGLLYARQNRQSATNAERTSDGYAVLNIQGFWSLTRELRLGVGVDNVMDSRYRDHLAGVNRVAGNPDIAPGERLPGYGRNIFARLDYRW
jgi:iron complex outermembrane receptor protein